MYTSVGKPCIDSVPPTMQSQFSKSRDVTLCIIHKVQPPGDVLNSSVELGCENLQQYPDNCLQSQQCENRSVYESIRTFFLKTKLMLTLLLCVFAFLVPCCDVRYDFRIKTMFCSSLLPVVGSRADVYVLFTLCCVSLCIVVSKT
jgi:hypothetical protein